MNKKTWAAISIISLGVFYFNLLWKTTGNIDSLTTDLLFYSAICSLLWRRKHSLVLNSDIFSSFIGLSLLAVLLIKSITLFSFEATLISLIPFFAAISLALITSGIRGIRQYQKEIFFAWFLFFPPGVIGHFIDRLIKITVLNAKLATYLLYYIGFSVSNQGNEVRLNLSELGQFTAVVDYPCAGVPMILLMLKLSLLLVCFFPFSRQQKILIPSVSIAIGFILGVIRVCILTLLIPEPTKFDYWHGGYGSQIFSTLAIIIFSIFAYWMLEKINYVTEKKGSINKKREMRNKEVTTNN
jgi:cyanoexosortase A